MKKLTFLILTLALGVTILSSCLGDTDYSYYDDAAITAFSLGTLNRYYTVEASDGSDSTYKKTLSCSSYTFYIDHDGGSAYGTDGLIWNPDSLPIEIDLTKVICTVSTKNSSVAAIKSMTSDSLTYYSSSDSIDFSEPREFWVYSASAIANRSYTVIVNKHQEVGDTCIWTSLGTNGNLSKLTDMKGLSDQERVYLFGMDGEVAQIWSTDITDGKTWKKVNELDGADSKSALIYNNSFYILRAREVLRSDDAATWESVNSDVDFAQLIGASTVRIYALTNDGELASSSEGGATWETEELDDDAAKLPTSDISFACRAMTTNEDTDKLVLIGSRSSEDYPTDTIAMVWSKVEEYSAGARDNKWNYVDFDVDNIFHRPPVAYNWQIANYDENNIKAMCGKAKNASTAETFDRVYHSGDDGITWRNDSIMCLPEGLSCSETEFAFFADGVNSLWIVAGTSGQVWKGRMNRVAWREEDKYFLKED